MANLRTNTKLESLTVKQQQEVLEFINDLIEKRAPEKEKVAEKHTIEDRRTEHFKEYMFQLWLKG